MARRQVSIFINGKEVANSIKGITAEKRKLNNELRNLTIGSTEYNKKAAELRKLDTIIRNHRDEVRGVSKGWDKGGAAIKKFAGIAAAAFTADALVRYTGELFTLGAEMQALTRKAEIVFGDSLPQVTAAAEKNAAAMGLTTSQYTDSATAIGDLLIPMGFMRDEAAGISTNLVDLSGALSEWTGGQIKAEEVTKILGKAVLGEREGLKQLGISIKESDVSARLAEKGLSDLTGQMLEQAKAAATLELVTEKSTDAQTAFANNSDLLVRKQAELGAKFTDIKERLATALIPVFSRLLDAAIPVIHSVTDLAEELTSAEGATSGVGAVLEFLGTILSNGYELWKLYYGILFQVGSFLFTNLAPAIKVVGSGLIEFYNILLVAADAAARLAGIEITLKPIDATAFRESVDSAAEYLNKIDEPTTDTPDPESTTPGAGGGIAPPPRKPPSGGGAKDKERSKLEERYQSLIAATAKYEEELRIAQLSATDQRITAVNAKYAEQIEQAKELQAKGITGAGEQLAALERLQAQELEMLRDEINQENIEAAAERFAKMVEAEQQLRIEQAEAEQEFQELLRELSGEDEDPIAAELQKVEEKYAALLELAEQYGFDVLAVEEARQAAITDINQKSADKQLAQDQELVQAQMALQESKIATFQSAASAISDIAGDNAAIAAAVFTVQKAIAAAEVIVNLQREIAAINAQYAAIPGGQIIAAGLSIRAKIRAGIGLATIGAQAVTGLVQRKKGGWLNATGADDGVTYRAQYIGRQDTGMLPEHPVVLASEAGPEYFVSNNSLRNPVILDHVRAIDAIQGKRGAKSMRQFQEGGATAPLPDTGSSAMQQVVARATAVLEKLESRGVIAIIEDDALIRMRERSAELDTASGGTI